MEKPSSFLLTKATIGIGTPNISSSTDPKLWLQTKLIKKSVTALEILILKFSKLICRPKSYIMNIQAPQTNNK